MNGSRIALPLGAAFACAIAALAVVPRGIEAETLLMAQDDPVRLADHALDRSFNADVAAREIEAALAANDADLAQSFLDLARDRNVPVDPALVARVEDANSAAAAAARAAGSFAHGLITGEPDDLAGWPAPRSATCSCSATSATPSARARGWRSGEPADELILGLAGVGHRDHRRHLCVARRRRAGAGRAVRCSRRRAGPAASPRRWAHGSAARCGEVVDCAGAAPRRQRREHRASPRSPCARCARR